jgi:putative spermidine/putrescine transport system substrate-binding protein
MMNLLTKTSLVFLLGTCGWSAAVQARDLTVVGFGGSLQQAFDIAYFKPFAAARGQHLIQDSYDGGIAKQKSMVESSTITWDLVQMDENEMAAACDQGVLEVLDRKKLLNANEYVPQAIAKCGVGAFVWSEVMSYDPKKFASNPPQSWADFWNLQKYPGKRGLRKQPRMTLEIALMADGVAPRDVYKVLATRAGQDRAFKKLDEIKPQIQWWDTGAQPLEWLASGTVSMTAAYNGRVSAAQKEGRQFPIVWHNQLFSMDYWTIIKGTPNKAAAYDLLNFTMDATNEKKFVETIPYGVANRQVASMIPVSLLSQLPTAPDHMQNALLLDTNFWLDHEEELVARFNKWVAQ